ncbi:hypothetical protein IQ238_16700 [Pleurocapsales cyanobacterium LEGE 06147]|nr:hypothetical protein [Pleurocapsales cyanobacterium LEGE 06147]
MNLAIVAAVRQHLLRRIAYGLLSLLGGIFGYVRAQSKASLISGSISGVLLIFAAFLQVRGIPEGLILARIITLVLLVVFVIRLVKTRKFMPAGLMVVAGVITLSLLFS